MIKPHFGDNIDYDFHKILNQEIYILPNRPVIAVDKRNGQVSTVVWANERLPLSRRLLRWLERQLRRLR